MTRFVYGIDGELLAEYRQDFAANAPTVEYGYCGGEQLITARPDETRWHVRDDVGTARIALDQTGSLANVRRNDYLPFGEELTNGVAGRTAARGYAPTTERNKFTGHQRDAGTGYDHTLWRKLDSVQGRWTSPDPYGGSMEIGNPQSFNRYAYVLNDPVNANDPLGLFRLAPRKSNYVVEISAPRETISGGGGDFSGLWSLWLGGGGGRRIQPLQPFAGEDGGGAMVERMSPVESPSPSVTGNDNGQRQRQSLARCYNQALSAYRAGRNSMGLLGAALDGVKQFSPLSITGGVNSLSGGFVGVATRGVTGGVRHSFVERSSTAFGKGFLRGGLGAASGAASTRFGFSSKVGQGFGGAGAAFAIGGLLEPIRKTRIPLKPGHEKGYKESGEEARAGKTDAETDSEQPDHDRISSLR